MSEAKVQIAKPSKSRSKIKKITADLFKNPAPRSWTLILLVAQALVAGAMILGARASDKSEAKPQTRRQESPSNEANLLEYVLEVEAKPEKQVVRHRSNKKVEAFSSPGLAKIDRPLELHLPAGTVIAGTLIGIEDDGAIRAKPSQSRSVRSKSPLPPGLILLGKASKTKRRLYLSFQEAMVPDGRRADIAAVGLDPNDKEPGLEFESLLNAVTRDLATASGTFLSGYGKSLQQERSYGPISATKPNPRSAALQGLGGVVTSHSDIIAPAGSESDLTGSSFLIKFL